MRFYLEDYCRKKGLAAIFSMYRYVRSIHKSHNIKSLANLADLLMHVPHTSFSASIQKRGHLIAKSVIETLAEKDNVSLNWTVLLKPPGRYNEPGVLMVSFETELLKLLRARRLSSLLDSYQICFLPTWQPFFSKEVFLLASISKRPFFILPSNLGEKKLCESFSANCQYIPLHAASWVNPDLYHRDTVKKDIDIVMLANFARHKRHWKLFEALRFMPENLNVCLYGVARGHRTGQELRKEASYFNVASRFTIVESAPDEVIRNALARSRLFCAFTHREGSYVGVAEALMAGVPVAMFRDAHIGTKVYLNKDTGFLLDPGRPLAPQLLTALARVDSMDPMSWAREHIASEKNSAILNKYLQVNAKEQGGSWAKDIEPVYSQRFDFYYHRGQKMEEKMSFHYQQIKDDYGVNIVRPDYHVPGS